MTSRIRPALTLALTVVLAAVLGTGCDKKSEPPAGSAPAPGATTAPATAPPAAPAPAVTAPAAPAVPATATAPASSGWVTYVQPQKLFSARFPTKPEESDSKTDSAIGPISIKMAMYSHASGKAYAAMASVYNVPSGTTFDIQKALDGARDGMIGKIPGAKILSEKPSKLDGYDGRDLAFEGPGPGGKTMQGNARMYASADPPAAYLAFTVNLTGSVDPDATTFMESLHVGKGVEAK